MTPETIARIKLSVDDCAAAGKAVIGFVVIEPDGGYALIWGTGDTQRCKMYERELLNGLKRGTTTVAAGVPGMGFGAAEGSRH